MPSSGEKKRLSSDTLTAVGIIIPVEWDDRGNPTAVAIATYNEKEYLIDLGNETGKRLHAAIHEKVEVKGVLGKKTRKRRILTVEAFKRL